MSNELDKEMNLAIDNIIKQARFNPDTKVSFYRGKIKAIFSKHHKLPEGEPPVLTYEDGHELRRKNEDAEDTLIGDTCEDSFDYGFEEGAQAQRKLDINWMKGVEDD